VKLEIGAQRCRDAPERPALFAGRIRVVPDGTAQARRRTVDDTHKVHEPLSCSA
jgi:hypothetical protein